MKGRLVDYDGTIAALPMAAAFTLLLCRLLPIHFEYRPNDLGIVSWTTERQYPLQQETFWAIFAVAAGGLPLAGWVANSPAPLAEAGEEIIDALIKIINGPLLGRVPPLKTASAAAVAACLCPPVGHS